MQGKYITFIILEIKKEKNSSQNNNFPCNLDEKKIGKEPKWRKYFINQDFEKKILTFKNIQFKF